jgi:hypothetical protein
MRLRLRHLVLTLIAVGAAATAIVLPQTSAAAQWPPSCPTGTNWDNSVQGCR